MFVFEGHTRKLFHLNMYLENLFGKHINKTETNKGGVHGELCLKATRSFSWRINKIEHGEIEFGKQIYIRIHVSIDF